MARATNSVGQPGRGHGVTLSWDIAFVERLCGRLEVRLRRDEARIRTAKSAGQDVTVQEQEWAALLRAYERLSDFLLWMRSNATKQLAGSA